MRYWWLMILFLLVGCSSSCPENFQKIELVSDINRHFFCVEIADEPAEWSQGLMNRDNLTANQGMLFVFPDAAPRSFWMKNTLIPLDILFFDKFGGLGDFKADFQPCDTINCPTYQSPYLASYVLEINTGIVDDQADYQLTALLPGLIASKTQ